MKVHPFGNYIPLVISSSNYTSPPSTAATFLATYLMAMLQPSGYSVFHSRDTSIWLGLPWQSYSCQYLNTETSAQSNRGYPTEIPSISYNRSSYIRLVVILYFASLIINENKLLLNSIHGVQWRHTKSPLTPISDFSDFFLSSEVVTIWQTDGTAYKLKPGSFHKSTHLWAHLADFHLWCEPHLTQDGLRDMWTCGMILASAYVLCYLSATWSQLQMMGRKSEWEWVLISVLLLNTGDWVQ